MKAQRNQIAITAEILCWIAKAPRTAPELAPLVKSKPDTMLKHLRELRDAGILKHVERPHVKMGIRPERFGLVLKPEYEVV